MARAATHPDVQGGTKHVADKLRLFPTADGTEKTQLNYCSRHGGHGLERGFERYSKTGPVTEGKSLYIVLIDSSTL